MCHQDRKQLQGVFVQGYMKTCWICQLMAICTVYKKLWDEGQTVQHVV